MATASTTAQSKRHNGRADQPGRGRRFIHGVLVIVAIVIVTDTLVGDRGLLAMRQAQKEYDELSSTIAKTKAENARLREEARRLREDPKAIEEIARRELGLIRPGEKVFIVRDIQTPTK